VHGLMCSTSDAYLHYIYLLKYTEHKIRIACSFHKIQAAASAWTEHTTTKCCNRDGPFVEVSFTLSPTSSLNHRPLRYRLYMRLWKTGGNHSNSVCRTARVMVSDCHHNPRRHLQLEMECICSIWTDCVVTLFARTIPPCTGQPTYSMPAIAASIYSSIEPSKLL